jgi:hypothetical protein
VRTDVDEQLPLTRQHRHDPAVRDHEQVFHSDIQPRGEVVQVVGERAGQPLDVFVAGLGRPPSHGHPVAIPHAGPIELDRRTKP